MGKKTEAPKSTKSTKRTPSTPRTSRTVSTPKGDVLDILFVTSEMRPFGKTGGLADVSSALPRALVRLGHRVTVVLPRYRGAATDAAPGWAADIPFGLHSYPVHFIEQRME